MTFGLITGLLGHHKGKLDIGKANLFGQHLVQAQSPGHANVEAKIDVNANAKVETQGGNAQIAKGGCVHSAHAPHKPQVIHGTHKPEQNHKPEAKPEPEGKPEPEKKEEGGKHDLFGGLLQGLLGKKLGLIGGILGLKKGLVGALGGLFAKKH